MHIDYDAMPEALPEGVDSENYIIGTYILNVPKKYPIKDIAQMLAVEQSTGTWIPVPEETPEQRKKHVAKVIAVHEFPNYEYGIPKKKPHPLEESLRTFFIQIAFPLNFTSQIPMMFTTVFGNISMAGPIKWIDVRFPKKWMEGFKGPKFGVEGIRKVLGVPERPLVNNMIKPCVYSPADVGAKLAYEVAAGGIDIIKDDELLAHAPYNTLEDRLSKFMEAIDRGNEETGEKTLYTINISDKTPDIFEHADKMIEMGANALMINYLTCGYSVARQIAEDPSIKVPILGHMDFAGAFYESPFSGVSSHLVLGKLARMIGMDMVIYPHYEGKGPVLKEKFLEVSKTLTYPFYHLKPTFPMPSGGITTSNIDSIVRDLGKDVIIATGGGIHAHPDGPRAGTRAFRQAIDAVMQGVPVKQYGKDHRELGISLGYKAETPKI